MECRNLAKASVYWWQKPQLVLTTFPKEKIIISEVPEENMNISNTISLKHGMDDKIIS
jgi:hypothetical protein